MTSNLREAGYEEDTNSWENLLSDEQKSHMRLCMRNKSCIYVRVHSKSWEKFKLKLKELSSRKCCQSIKPSLERIKVYARGWLNYYGIASMKNNINDINGWLYHRIRMCMKVFMSKMLSLFR